MNLQLPDDLPFEHLLEVANNLYDKYSMTVLEKQVEILQRQEYVFLMRPFLFCIYMIFMYITEPNKEKWKKNSCWKDAKNWQEPTARLANIYSNIGCHKCYHLNPLLLPQHFQYWLAFAPIITNHS